MKWKIIFVFHTESIFIRVSMFSKKCASISWWRIHIPSSGLFLSGSITIAINFWKWSYYRIQKNFQKLFSKNTKILIQNRDIFLQKWLEIFHKPTYFSELVSFLLFVLPIALLPKENFEKVSFYLNFFFNKYFKN